jgi:hypothetical protein
MPLSNLSEFSAGIFAGIDVGASRRRHMAQVYFYCSNAKGKWFERPGIPALDLAEAYQEAVNVMRSIIAAPNLEDWRSWVLHVSDDTGEEIFSVPFASMLGQPH